MTSTRIPISAIVILVGMSLAAAPALAGPPVIHAPAPVGVCKSNQAREETCTTEWMECIHAPHKIGARSCQSKWHNCCTPNYTHH